MHKNDAIVLERDCDAILIPAGTPITLPKGSTVHITQALGGTYTVNINGNLARIGEEEARTLGIAGPEPDAQPMVASDTTGGNGTVDEELVWELMKTCYDPEIPINIVDLGLIYDCKITQLKEGGSCVDILMTLTAPGCGMGQYIAYDVQRKVESVPNVTHVNVELTFDPPWNQSMMSETARLATGMY